MNKKFLKYFPRIILILFFIGWFLFVYFYSPTRFIDSIGIRNSYLLIFILAFLGGLATFTAIPYHLVLIMLAAGGSDPLFLGLATAGGVIGGDSVSYCLGYHGGKIVPQKMQKILQRFNSFCLKHPKLLPLFFVLYGSLSPFSNDFIAVSMGLARYPFRKVMIPLGLGNLIFNVSLAFLAKYAYGFLQGIV